jgi:RNA polymerase sigma-70 factor (ECF subfamily)
MENYHNVLFPYAYNILGSVEDARDAIQEVVTNYLSAKKDHIENKAGYLIKAVINQSVNVKKRNAKINGERIWLPEPMATERADGNIHREELISYSMLVLLEQLGARERAVFILKEAFDYAHDEIAATLDISIANSRKLLSRARAKLTEKKEETASASITQDFMQQYINVIKSGDVKALEKLLSNDIALAADGGGKINVVRELTIGKEATRDLLFYVFQTYLERLDIRVTEMNHQPALLFMKKGRITNCQVFDIKNGKINRIFSVIAPEKLRSLN